MMNALEFHPYADLFPLIEGADFEAFCASFRRDGYDRRQPIVTYGNQILDGRNRYRACEATGVAPQFREFDPESEGGPLDFVIRMNLPRRHLDESQRALVAARIANLHQGRPEKKPANLPVKVRTTDNPAAHDDKALPAAVTQDQAAHMLNVSPRSLRAAKVVQERATPELRHAVEQGKITVSAAAQAADLATETQQRIAAEAEAGRANAARAVIKQERRDKREATLGTKQQSLPQQKFGIILADPEWKWKPWSEAGMDRGVENTYPTTETTDIAARDVQSIAADDCVLVLWARADMLPEALQVMGAWGFCYVAQRVWRKSRMSTGYWFRYDHELVLIGKRGKPVAPAMGTQERSVFEGEPAVPGLNSSKPECVAEWIERNWPNTPKIELNRRGPARPGWAAWGNESEPSISEPAVSTPLIRRGESEPESDPGFSAGSLMDGDPTDQNAQRSPNRDVSAGDRPWESGVPHGHPTLPQANAEAGATTELSGRADRGGRSEREAGASVGALASQPKDEWAELDIPKFLRRVPESQGSSPAAPVETAADLAADGSCSTESSAAFSQESQTGATFIAPIPVAAPGATAGSGVGSAVVSSGEK